MKILIIRFSSIGDVTQALSLPSLIKRKYPTAEIHFLTRLDLSEIVFCSQPVTKIWTVDKTKGLKSLWSVILELRQQKYDVVYDAHNNLRSFLVRFFLYPKLKIVKPMNRIKRFLLLNFKINLFPQPFSGQMDLIRPLEKMGLKAEIPANSVMTLPEKTIQETKKILLSNGLTESDFNAYYVFVPSAAHFFKRWPIKHWITLAQKNPTQKIVVLAGSKDLFTKELNSEPNIINLTGLTTLLQSAAVIQLSRQVITNDTGMLHFSEQLGKKTVALMGPAPFGYPSRTATTTTLLEKKLKCKPCSKHGQGPCVNKAYYHECMDSITPEEVQNALL